MVPPVLVRLPAEDSVTLLKLPVVACKLPLTLSVPEPTVREKGAPLPAEEASRLTVPAVSLVMVTLPVELAVRVPAFVDETEMPPVSLDKVRLGVDKVPVEEMPPPEPIACNVTDVLPVTFLVRLTLPVVEDS
jgi:hypothetical protein